MSGRIQTKHCFGLTVDEVRRLRDSEERGDCERLYASAGILADMCIVQAERVTELEAERDAYKRAKEENDDRFMRERDEARARAEAAKADLNRISTEMGLPPGVGPTDGELTRLLKELRLQIKEAEAAATLSSAMHKLTNAQVEQAHARAASLGVQVTTLRCELAQGYETRDALIAAYAATHGPMKVTATAARQLGKLEVQFDRSQDVYEVLSINRPSEFPARLGLLVMLAVRYVTTTMTEDNADALLQALACPAICAADPVRLGTAATELASHVNDLRGGRRESFMSPLSMRAEKLARCCRLLLPYLEAPTRVDVLRRLGDSVEPPRVNTHDRDCLCQVCLDEAGRGR